MWHVWLYDFICHIHIMDGCWLPVNSASTCMVLELQKLRDTPVIPSPTVAAWHKVAKLFWAKAWSALQHSGSLFSAFGCTDARCCYIGLVRFHCIDRLESFLSQVSTRNEQTNCQSARFVAAVLINIAFWCLLVVREAQLLPTMQGRNNCCTPLVLWPILLLLHRGQLITIQNQHFESHQLSSPPLDSWIGHISHVKSVNSTSDHISTLGPALGAQSVPLISHSCIPAIEIAHLRDLPLHDLLPSQLAPATWVQDLSPAWCRQQVQSLPGHPLSQSAKSRPTHGWCQHQATQQCMVSQSEVQGAGQRVCLWKSWSKYPQTLMLPYFQVEAERQEAEASVGSFLQAVTC